MNTLSSVQKRPPANIFVIDDNPEMVSLITTILSDAGYGVDSATDPAAALEKELLPRSRVLMETRLIHDSWRKGCRDERTKARGGFGGGRP